MQLYSKFYREVNECADLGKERKSDQCEKFFQGPLKYGDRFKSLFRPLKLTLKYNTQCVKCQSDSYFTTSTIPDTVEAQSRIKEIMTKSIVSVNEDQLKVVGLNTELNALAKCSTDKTKVTSKNKLYLKCLMPVSFLNEQKNKLYLADDQFVFHNDKCDLSFHQQTINGYDDELSFSLGRFPREGNDLMLPLQKPTTEEHNDELPLILDKITRDENDYKLASILSNSSVDKKDNLAFILERYSTNAVDCRKNLNKLTTDVNSCRLSLLSDKSVTERIVQNLPLNKHTTNNDSQLTMNNVKRGNDSEQSLTLHGNNSDPTLDRSNSNTTDCRDSLNKSILKENHDRFLILDKLPTDGNTQKLSFVLNRLDTTNETECQLSGKSAIDEDGCPMCLDKSSTDGYDCHSYLEKPTSDEDSCLLSLDKPTSDEDSCLLSLDKPITGEDDFQLLLKKPTTHKDECLSSLEKPTNMEDDCQLCLIHPTNEVACQLCSNKSIFEEDNYHSSLDKCINDEDDCQSSFEKHITDKDDYHSSLDKPTTDTEDCPSSLQKPIFDTVDCHSSLGKSITEKDVCKSFQDKSICDMDYCKSPLNQYNSDEYKCQFSLKKDNENCRLGLNLNTSTMYENSHKLTSDESGADKVDSSLPFTQKRIIALKGKYVNLDYE
ncbi:hypothetical protein TNIN_28951 [Trichonephila inaurata madagascariensis]|uniref:Uncharacterized protein n=1 Tax=Trichonephila inaurata madagascariensis TaxID=2747483 RepID=A0A8X6I7X2_9ARAC|nr:hypothetical protein TNIN_28951 [Trichonephila inaurata madagascariensis]